MDAISIRDVSLRLGKSIDAVWKLAVNGKLDIVQGEESGVYVSVDSFNRLLEDIKDGYRDADAPKKLTRRKSAISHDKRLNEETIGVMGKSLSQIARFFGVPYATLSARYKQGARTVDELLGIRGIDIVDTSNYDYNILINGKPLSYLSKKYGIPVNTLYVRYYRGARTLEELTKPLRGAK